MNKERILDILPESLKLTLQIYITNIFEKYFSLTLLIIYLILFGLLGVFLYKKYKYKFLKKWKLSIILLIFLAFTFNFVSMKIYWRIKSEPATFTIGILNFFVLDETGNFNINKHGIKLKQYLYENLNDIYGKECKTFSRIADPKFILLEQSSSDLLKTNPLNIEELFRDYTVSKRVNIIIWGMISENGTLEKFHIYYKPTFFYEKGFLAIDTKTHIKKMERLISESIKTSDITVQAKIIANLFYSFISQSPAVSASIRYKDPLIGLKILEESKKVFNATLYLIDKVKNIEPLINWYEIVYDINSAEVLAATGNNDKAIEKIYDVLKKNIFFPLESYEIFKAKYSHYYAYSVAERTIKRINSDKEMDKLSARVKFFKYDEELFLIEYFNQLILESKNYFKYLEYYNNLAKQYPNNSIVYLFWGDAIKLYGTEPLKLNLDRVDAAIEKYKIAEQKDPNWFLIGSKIFITSTLQMIQEEERGNIQKAKQIQKTLDSYRGKQIKFYESSEVKQYIEK